MKVKKRVTKKKRISAVRERRELAIAIQLAWDSLLSHLYSSVYETDISNPRFQAECVLDYVRIMLPLARSLHANTKKVYPKLFGVVTTKVE